VSELGDFIAVQANLANQVMRLPEQSSIRGLNPGLAMGKLVVVAGSAEEMEVSKDNIYLFMRPPSDLKPVAGIATVSEGNMVSHVQLLARNLGIPNAVISESNLQQLLPFSGQQVFYAVSNRGTVIMKAAADMTAEEKALFTTKSRNENKIRVPVEKIELTEARVLNMREVNAASSGKVCGPKAANLGQLKSLFPDQVVEGLVIPFGIFRAHLDQAMPGQPGSYWSYLNASFEAAETLRQQGKTENEVEAFLLEKMAVLQTAIKNIPLLPDFQAELERGFQNAFGKPLGQVPIFIRSDTNMEDLKEFTGAGLNLTLFNVLDQNKIIQGIKEVWASPYTERSFKWRQRYLLNPENVFPSILIIPSVDVEYSGVLITKGIPNAEAKDLTIAFSRGAGGAVDGQAAESYLMTWQGEDRLISPARESRFRRLPATGGTETRWASFAQPILSEDNLAAIRALSEEMKRLLPNSPGMESGGPYDIELGFENNKIWLFQVRPFVENKSALNSAYLESISPKMSVDTPVSLATKL
jgi:phosphoenolpyruvate synthase/pyruvate phosphate dikinase